MKNIAKNNDIRLNRSYIFWGLFLIFYQIFTTIFFYLPLLYGMFFCYMFYLLNDKDKRLAKLDFRWYFSLFYLAFIDILHNFYIFSSWFAFLLFYYICADWIKVNLKIGKLIPVIYVICAYLFIYFVNVMLLYFMNEDIIYFGYIYIVYMIIESFFAYIFFKDKF